ncbi:inner membrane protein YhjD [Candidatus Pantoea carbekii]|uniref:Uncharacterized protein n=1 Tax=Candidatus Pantoea carbekii TaxID=1235990 RepID=U3U757_9GAMM|nr:inner membrane protein YhjD [Candidatus Pantoea carbekii]AKC32445.1 inner membrane protein YhjD [Candidatus Pantoea carbekii]BAO00172.1 hypothetical protein HHS_02020 [Candidatus Pantoea carbekii]
MVKINAIKHFQRAINRFHERLGNQFGAAIAYFSILSIIPILMFTFSVFGFIAAFDQELFNKLVDKIIHSIKDPTLVNILKNMINTAIQQRTKMGLTGLLLTIYSSINWMSNVRQAISLQLYNRWQYQVYSAEKIWKKYIRDVISFIGLIIALIITLLLTVITGWIQVTVIHILKLRGLEWLYPLISFSTILISILTNYLVFLWLFWSIPRYKPNKTALFRGTMLAAISFEFIKFVMTFMIPKIISSPSGIAFGSVLTLMAFFYCFALITLFCAAWISTAKYTKNTY